MERMTVEQALNALASLALDAGGSIHMDALATLRAELDGLLADAERYQLARRILTLTAIAPLARDYFRFGDYAYMQKVDAAIDAARQEKGHE